MRFLSFLILVLIANFSFATDEEKVKTEAEILEITIHKGKRFRETAMVKFELEDGSEMVGSCDLFRIPFIGSLNSVGDKIGVKYSKSNPAIIETVFGHFLSTYGMYILIFLGIIFSIRPFLKYRKGKTEPVS